MSDVTKPCSRCGVNPRNSTLKSYCVECKRAIARALYAKSGGKNRLTYCSRCKQERTGSHPTYCAPCASAYRAEQPCPRCGESKAGPNGTKSPYCVPCFKAYRLLKTYGITIEQYDALISAQNGCCAVCGGSGDGKPWHVDHCHDTGKVRGILCALCNRGIGHFRESAALLRAAADYLERATAAL